MKVSVVIPVYNVEAYLEECLDCVVNQTLQDLEIICVNDGSTDRSAEILRDFAKADDRIIVIEKKNSGYGHAVNMGVRVAQGEYIGIVEPDDFLELDMMEELYRFASVMKLDVIKADFDIVRGEMGSRSYSGQKICKNHDFYRKVMNAKENPEIFHASLYTWAGIYRRDFLLEHQIWHNETPGASYQDNGFWFQVFVKARSVYFLDRSFYHLRRDNPGSSIMSRQKVYCVCDEYDFIRRKLFEWKEEGYLPVQWYWRFQGYVGTLKRIASKYKDEFLSRFQTDFLKAFQAGELQPELFGEDWGFLEKVMGGDTEGVYRSMFFDRELLHKLRSAGKVILYGDEDRVRDICKRVEQYQDPAVNLAGVALANGGSRGVVWNRQVSSLENLVKSAGKAAVWLAVPDDCGKTEQIFRSLGYTQFIAMPEYIKGIGNV